MTGTFTPDPGVKAEFELLEAALENILAAVGKAKKKYCEGVPKSDPEVSALYNEINVNLEQVNLFDDHIAGHHP